MDAKSSKLFKIIIEFVESDSCVVSVLRKLSSTHDTNKFKVIAIYLYFASYNCISHKNAITHSCVVQLASNKRK